jgi:hypothetical protein
MVLPGREPGKGGAVRQGRSRRMTGIAMTVSGGALRIRGYRDVSSPIEVKDMRDSRVRSVLVLLLLALAAFSNPSSAAPTAPGPTSVACSYSVSDNCWVTGDFVASVSPATGGTGSLVYQICRSVDSSGGFAGCDVNLTLNGGTSITVSGTHVPADGYRRAYYFLARDSAGVLGPWNSPRYVRVDRSAPAVSATNASDTWFASRTATLSASDTTGGAAANSGLADVRYRWNSPLDSGCSAGTTTSSGATLTAPNGDNVLYLCARDNTGRVGQWNGRYRVSAPPTAPGPTTVACAYSNADNCWVTGDFAVSVTPATGGAGSLVYEICRSIDSAGGFAGCDVSLTLNGSTSFTVTGTHVPADGFRRAYYFLARDSAGVLGPWNAPRYVRVDRYAPAVSASNASDTWFSSRTATVSAGDVTGGAGANSGLLEVRYGWNAAPNAACTTGTVTAPGATLTAPAGDNLLYLCARDNTGRVATWNGRYRVSAPPTAPGPTTVACAYSASDDCWVTGDFTASVTPATGGSGSLVYQICRSIDSPGGFAGCDVNLTLNGGTSILVNGTHLPADGSRRAYYFLARDTLGVLGPWNGPRYVRVDRYAPTVSASNASDEWFASRTATVSAADTTAGATANSGLFALRYRWGTPLDAACTAGTATAAGATLTAPAGDNLLYLCGRDNTGRVGTWSGRYRVSTPVTEPGPTSVVCSWATGDDCWVTTDFGVSVTPATGGTGTFTYQVCRSVDSTGGFAGCDVNLTLNSGLTFYAVTGAHTPADGFRRAYWFRAQDSAGVWGPWNTPRYVRMDRYTPAVSATNASDTWATSLTATLSASDVTGGAGANSGLAALRYSWNAALDPGCTTGTAATSGAALTAPAGDNVLYLCARDNAGRIGTWNGRYRVGTTLTEPGPTTVACAWATGDDCWVAGGFGISVTPATGGAGSLVYQICRSVDSAGGFAGCDINLTLNGGTATMVAGAHLPGDGSRRAYYFRARDSVGALGPWNTPRYVRIDRYDPVVSATNASDQWFPSRTATLSAADAAGGAGANSGLVVFRYSWNAAPNAACSNGTLTASGTTLTAPAGDNLLYLCARDNTGRVGTWNGRYRVGEAPLSLTTTPSPAQSVQGTTITWRATATGGDPLTRQYALFKRRLGDGSGWHPSLTEPAWQTGRDLRWTPAAGQVGVWEIAVWVKDAGTPPNANTFGYAAAFDPGPVEVVAPAAGDFLLAVSPPAATVVRGNQAHFTVGLTADPGFTGTAALSVSGLPAAASHTLAPAAIGVGTSATLTVTTTGDTPDGTYEITVTATAGSLTRTATASLTVRGPSAPGAPVIDSITPEQFDGGVVKTITLRGSNFQGATVTVAEEDPDPDNPTSRAFPTVGQTVISADGTRIDVQVDCTAPQVMDYYALVVDNGVGEAAASRPFRVIPGGPVIDLVTPNQPERGEDHVYVLSLAGFHLRNATVRVEPAGALDIFGLDTGNDTHINGLLRVPDNAPLGPVDIVVRDAQGRQARITIEVVGSGAAQVVTQEIRTQRIDPATGAAVTGPSPSVFFQRFAVRQPENTELTESGLHMRASSSPENLSAASFELVLYYRYTLNLFNFTWSRAFVFDPVTGRIGDAILQGLGLGERVRFGAFVLAFHLRVDLTIEVYVSLSGFTWPRFCISISVVLQIPGLEGFIEQWDYCRGGGFVPFNTGSTNSLDASGGSCAGVTQEGPPQDGLIFAEAEQKDCCEQPIEVTGEGVAFTGSSIATTFNVTTPNAGVTTPGPSCTCSIGVAPKCLLVGKDQKFRAQGNPPNGTFQWTLNQSGNRASITAGATSSEVTVRGNSPSGAADDITLQLAYTAGGSTCTQAVTLSVIGLDATTPLEFRTSGEADTQNAKRNIPMFGLPTLGEVSPGVPPGTTGYHKNMQIRARITPADPNLQCRFDFKRLKQGVVGQGNPDGTTHPVSGSCEQGWCDDDAGNTDDEDLLVDAPPGGSIYVLDTPGLRPTNNGACQGGNGVVLGTCFNFREWLEVDGVAATAELNWYAATRLKCDGTRFQPDGGGAGNHIAQGSAVCSQQVVLAPVTTGAGPVVAALPRAPEPTLDSVARLTDASLEVRNAAYEALLAKTQSGELLEKERAETVAALLEVAQGEAVDGELEAAPLLAMRLLGELRAEEAIPLLLDRLTDEFTRAIIGDSDWVTPAAQALVKIGKPALAPMVSMAAGASEEEWGVLRASLALMKDQKSVQAEVSRQLGEGAGEEALTRLKGLIEK